MKGVQATEFGDFYFKSNIHRSLFESLMENAEVGEDNPYLQSAFYILSSFEDSSIAEYWNPSGYIEWNRIREEGNLSGAMTRMLELAYQLYSGNTGEYGYNTHDMFNILDGIHDKVLLQAIVMRFKIREVSFGKPNY